MDQGSNRTTGRRTPRRPGEDVLIVVDRPHDGSQRRIGDLTARRLAVGDRRSSLTGPTMEDRKTGGGRREGPSAGPGWIF